MPRYPIGQGVRLEREVRNLDGDLTTPDTLVLTLLLPDGTTEDYASPVEESTGVFHQDLGAADLPLVGPYAYTWTSSVPDTVVYGRLSVYDPLRAFLTLDDAKDHLNIPLATTTQDDELGFFVDAAVYVVERLAGAVMRREVVEVVRQRGGGGLLLLSTRPVVSVTTLTEVGGGGGEYDVAALYVANPMAGIVRRTDGGAIVGGPWTAEYVAGRATAPENIGLAARVLVQHLWETQRGGPLNAPRLDVGMQEGYPGVWFAVPNKVKELLEGASVALMAY